jgi:hypothetical protein
VSDQNSNEDRNNTDLYRVVESLAAKIDSLEQLLIGDAEILPAEQNVLFVPEEPPKPNRTSMTLSRFRSAPIPGPDEIGALERIRPVLGVRILDDHHDEMTERTAEYRHRRTLEEEDQDFSHRFYHRGQNQSIWSLVVATLLALSMLGLAWFMTSKGHPTEAATIVVGGIGAVVSSVWAGGKRSSSNEGPEGKSSGEGTNDKKES